MPPRRWAKVFDDWLVGKISFADWLLASLNRPDNFPAYLNVIVTLVLALFAFLAWLDTKQQLDLLREQQRPWIYFDKPDILAWTTTSNASKKVLQAAVRFNVSNSGKTPGEFFRAFPFLDLPDPVPTGYAQDEADVANRCAEVRSDIMPSDGKSPRIYGQIVFPNQKAFQVFEFRFDDGEIEKRLRTGDADVLLLGCGDYKSSLDTIHHQTHFAYKIRLKNNVVASHEIEASDVETVISPYFPANGD